MTKGKWILFIILGIALAAVVVFLIVARRNSAANLPSSENTIEAPPPVQAQIRAYTDPAGFSFSYPDIMTLEKNEIDDDSTYSSIKLTDGDAPRITILVEDTAIGSLEEWLEQNTSTAAKITDLKLGDLDAQQVSTTKGITTVALDQGVLFTVWLAPNSSPDEAKAYATVISSFIFKQPEIQAAPESAGNGEDSYVEFEGEEVIE